MSATKHYWRWTLVSGGVLELNIEGKIDSEEVGFFKEFFALVIRSLERQVSADEAQLAKAKEAK
jgi:hypothetical protein